MTRTAGYRVRRLERHVGTAMANQSEAAWIALYDSIRPAVRNALILQFCVDLGQRRRESNPVDTGAELNDAELRALFKRLADDIEARYCSMTPEAFLATLPHSYECGSCGETVTVDVAAALQSATEPWCGCGYPGIE